MNKLEKAVSALVSEVMEGAGREKDDACNAVREALRAVSGRSDPVEVVSWVPI